MADCMFSMLQQAVHQVRTSWLIPMYGIGQGNGAGPAIWAVVSTPILDILRSMGFGFSYITPISNQFIRFVGFAFVDDTDLLHM
jgi:hypothetical protein